MSILGYVLPWWARWAALALAVAVVWGHGWVKGNNHGSAKLERYVAQQAVETSRLAAKRQEVTERVVTKYRTIVKQAEPAVQTIEKEVVRYANVNPGICLDPRWGELHDAAALGQVPTAAGGADGAGRAPEAPTAYVALDTVTANYAACRRTADRLDGLQSWVRGQAVVK